MELVLNGINGADGKYLFKLGVEELLAAGGLALPQGQHQQALAACDRRDRRPQVAARYGIDVRNLSHAGWGVIFADDADPGIADALGPLLALREAQAAAKQTHFFQEYVGARGHRVGESAFDFIARNGHDPLSDADPERVPYYLLIVGSPERIPFRFQYELDVVYAVGRLHFDSVEDYASYARAVVNAEEGRVKPVRRATFFSALNPNDNPTRLSSTLLAEPLTSRFAPEYRGWRIEPVHRTQAVKTRLSDLITGNPPGLLFTATHGIGLDQTDPRLAAVQGALLCSDWQGSPAGVSGSDYYAAGDVPDTAALPGTILFHFGCYTAGTPAESDFPESRALPPERIAPKPFVAALPKRLLSLPNGAALAAVGHVERAWTCSFTMGDNRLQIATFDDTIRMLFDGYPVGAAMETFNRRYAAAATKLIGEVAREPLNLDQARRLLPLWTLHNDARNYAVLGDPAVKLCGASPA